MFQLYLEGLTFPPFKNDNSKKNFRLLFDVDFRDDSKKAMKSLVTMPAEGEWQWNDSNKPYYIPILNQTATSVQLDLSVFPNNAGYFSETDGEVIEKEGDLKSIKVTVMDVHDPSFGDQLVKIAKIAIPEAMKAVSGGIVPVIGQKVVATVAKEYIEGDLSDLILSQIKASKDKVLYKGGRYAPKTKSKIVIDGDGIKGKYSVQLEYK